MTSGDTKAAPRRTETMKQALGQLFEYLPPMSYGKFNNLCSEISKLEELAEMASECFDCCNVYGKKCGVEGMRKAIKAHFGEDYAPAFLPEKEKT